METPFSYSYIMAILKCGPMPNVMVALPNTGSALCSTRKVWLMPTTRVLCSNAAKTRKPLKFAGVPQTRQQISAVRRPKFTILWGQVEDVSVFNKFFPIVDTCLSCENTARQSCAIFCVLYFQLAACSTFQTCILNSHKGHTMCGSMVDIQSLTAEIRRGKKTKERNHRAKIWWSALLHRATTIKQSFHSYDCKHLQQCTASVLVTHQNELQ